MKSNHLKKIIFSLAIILLANLSTHAQSCIYAASHNITEIYSNGDGICDYEIDLCAIVNGSPRPKRIVYTVTFDTNGDDNKDSSLSYEFDPPENHISNGSYCLSTMSGDESFVITIPCGGEIRVSVIGYKSNSGGKGGACLGLSEDVSTATLPVELVNFHSTVINDQVLLEWATASEIDHDYFAVERSTDSNGFKMIGQVNGTEASHQLKYYNFTDLSPETGDNFYRLRQVDLSGHTEFSEIRTVKVAINKAYTIYPSFAREKVTVDFGRQLESAISIRVIDMSGKLVKRTQADRGQKEVVIGTADLVNGAYMVAFEGDRVVLKTGRFLKVG